MLDQFREKTKASWEHFYNNYLFTASEEKLAAQQRFIGYVTQGKRRGVLQLYKKLTKADTVQT